MKRTLSLLLALCMIISMLPVAVFAEEITELGAYTVSFEENAEPYTYTYIAEGNGTVSASISGVTSETEGAAATIELYNDTTSTYGETVDGSETVAVSQGDEVTITITMQADEETFSSPAATVEWYGLFTATVGTESNPIWLNAGENAITVEAGATVYYTGRFGGMNMTAVGEGATVAHNGTTYEMTAEGVSFTCVQADMWSPCVFVVTNTTDAAVSCTLTAEYPVGSQMNPEVIEEMSWYYGNVSQTEGTYDGYYYTYTAVADGTITLYFTDVPYVEAEDGTVTKYTCDISLTNQNTYEQKTLLMDGVDNYGLEVTMDVNEGDVIQIVVIAVQDTEGNYYPAAEMTWCGNFAYPSGSEKNPINIEWEWDAEYANATASVTVAAGETVYYTGNAGMILTVDGVETAQADGVFSITNSGEAEATYALALATPVGAYNNPEIIENVAYFSDTNSLEADASYYYIWTATEDTTVVLDVTDGANITVDRLTYEEGSEWPISEQFTLAEPEIDENWNYTGWIVAENLVIDVLAGQQLKIQVAALTDWTTWTTPAIEYTLNIDYASGTSQNPIFLGGLEHTLENAGTKWYQGYFSGTVLTVAGEGEFSVIYNGETINSVDGKVEVAVKSANPRMPVIFAISGDGVYAVNFAYPAGSQMNPEVIEEMSWYYGNVSQAEGTYDGYYYTYTAVADGTITLYFTDVPYVEAEDGTVTKYTCDISLTNQNTYEQKTLLMDGVDNYGLEVTMDVNEGDVIQIVVIAVQDAEGNYYPAAEMTWCGNFAYPAGSEKNPIYIEWEWDAEYANATASVTVAAGETVYYSGNDGMILTVDGVETAQDGGVFSITNSGEAEATYALALATPVGAYNNPEIIEDVADYADTNSLEADASYYYIWTATEDATVVLDVTDGANLSVDRLTYTKDSEWPIAEQFILAEPEIDENWNYTGWIVADNLKISVKAGQQLKIQVNGLTDWTTWTTPAIEYTLSINYVYEAMIGDVAYKTLLGALAAAESGDVVKLSADTVVDSYLVLPVGVTLDLAEYSLTTEYIYGSKESSIIGTPAVAKLILPQGNIIVGKGATNEEGQYVLPIWDPANGCYQMSKFVVNTASDVRGLFIDEAAEKIYFQFKHQASGEYNKPLLGDGASDNELSVIIRLEWKTYDEEGNEKGIAYQNFVYNDNQISKVSGIEGSYDYTFTLTGYSVLGVDLDSLAVTGIITTNCGADAYGTRWTVADAK